MDSEILALQDALAGEYSFDRELGRGGMGVVYLARDIQLDRPVAVKILPHTHAGNPEVRERFLREARTAARLSHPNIVPIHRVGEAAGIPYFVMTYIEGATLGERLRERGPISPSTMAQILRDVAQALGYAHGRGIVHRDVKPDNILLDTETGRAMVTDFGIAAAIGEGNDAAPSGTIGFMSPEQMLGQPADGRSDLYALGVVAHLSLTGSLPGEQSKTAVAAGEWDRSLSGAIARCLSRDPADRYSDAEALLEALDPSRAVVKSTLPPDLRAWAGDQVPLLPLYGFLGMSGIMSAAFAVGLSLGPSTMSMGLWFASGLVALSAVPVLAFQIRKTKRALAAGYRISDLRFALRAWNSERIAEIDRAHETRSRGLKALSMVPLPSFSVALGATVCMGKFGSAPGGTRIAFSLIEQVAMFFGLGSMAALSITGTPLLPKSLYKRLVGRARGWMWNGRIGSWLAKKLAPKGGGVPLAAFRPTELALEVAIDDLFAALPESYKSSLSDLPGIAHRLIERAGTLRASAANLSVVTGDSEEVRAEVERARAASAAGLAETMTAIERLRVGLLRLHGGLADMQPVATALDAARALDRQVNRIADAQVEIGGNPSVLAFERTSPSPA